MKYITHKPLLEDNIRDPLYEETSSLNHLITRAEAENVVFRSKNGKSVSFNKNPSEVLKFQTVIDSLQSLFNFCLDCGLIISI